MEYSKKILAEEYEKGYRAGRKSVQPKWINAE